MFLLECGASAIQLVMFWFLEKMLLQHKMFCLSNFLLMFPPKQLSGMVHWTNVQLNKASMKETTASEVLKFFGILIRLTKFEFTTTASLWNTVA
jgi:hypothetical protein